MCFLRPYRKCSIFLNPLPILKFKSPEKFDPYAVLSPISSRFHLIVQTHTLLTNDTAPKDPTGGLDLVLGVAEPMELLIALLQHEFRAARKIQQVHQLCRPPKYWQICFPSTLGSSLSFWISSFFDCSSGRS